MVHRWFMCPSQLYKWLSPSSLKISSGFIGPLVCILAGLKHSRKRFFFDIAMLLSVVGFMKWIHYISCYKCWNRNAFILTSQCAWRLHCEMKFLCDVIVVFYWCICMHSLFRLLHWCVLGNSLLTVKCNLIIAKDINLSGILVYCSFFAWEQQKYFFIICTNKLFCRCMSILLCNTFLLWKKNCWITVITTWNLALTDSVKNTTFFL